MKLGGAWYRADAGWRADVWLDGVDVTRQCSGIYIAGERPLAVELYRPNADGPGPYLDRATRTIPRDVVFGDIRIERHRRSYGRDC